MDEDKLTRINRNFGVIIGLQRDEALERFSQLLSDDDPAQRVSAVAGLRKLGGQEAVALLSRTLNDSNSFVSNGALRAIVAIGGPEASEYLSAALSNSDFTVRLAAIDALGQIGNAQAITILEETLRGTSTPSRAPTIESEVEIKPQQVSSGFSQAMKDRSREILMSLNERLTGERDRRRETRKAAAKALGAIGGEEVLAILKNRLFWEKDYGVKFEIDSAIAAILSMPQAILGRPRAARPIRPDLNGRPRAVDNTSSLEGRQRSQSDEILEQLLEGASEQD